MSGLEAPSPVRRSTLRAVLDHLAPAPGPAALESMLAVAVDELETDRLGGFRPAVWATLDELAERARDRHGCAFESLEDATREVLLRELESGDNPHLAHAVALLLQLALEASLGGAEAPGLASAGLPSEGQARCLRPTR